MTSFGVWVDDAPKVVATDAFMDRAEEVGYSTLAIMLDSSRSAWDPRYSLQQLREAGYLAVTNRDMEIVLTVWPTPHKGILDEMFADLDLMLDRSMASGLEVDLEGLWKTSKAREMGWNIDDASKYLLEGLSKLRERHDVRLEVTTHTGSLEATARARVAPHVDRVLWQVYSTRHNWRAEAVNWRDRYGPFGRSADCDRLAELAKTWGVKCSFGAAVWDQKWPGHRVEEALEVAFENMIIHEPTEIRDWSSGRTIGRFRDAGFNPQISEWRRDFIIRTRNGAIS